MPDQQAAIGELRKAKTVTGEAVNGAVDAIFVGDLQDVFPVADGLVLDLIAAVKATTRRQSG